MKTRVHIPPRVPIDVEPLGLCPCGQEIFVNQELAAVAHRPPTCEMFDQLEVDEFLRYVRRSRGIPDPVEPS